MKCILVEDNFNYALEIEILLKELDIKLIETIDNGKDALVSILTKNPDLVIMDIELKGKLKGTDVAEKITHLNIPIIFVTSFDTKENFENAKKANNYGFLTKPIKKFDLQRTIDLINSRLNSSKENTLENEEYLLIKSSDNFHKVEKAKINFIKAEGNYANVFIEKNSYLTRSKLTELEKILPSNFIRCHRSYIVNLHFLNTVNFKDGIIKIGEESVNINSAAKKQIERYFKILK